MAQRWFNVIVVVWSWRVKVEVQVTLVVENWQAGSNPQVVFARVMSCTKFSKHRKIHDDL
jgi:hypothetical protein